MAINIDQFMTDYNSAKTKQGDAFDSSTFGRDYDLGANRDRTQPEDNDSMSRKGFIMETTEALAGGAVDTAELWMRAVRAVDPQGGNETIRNFATFGLDAIKNFVAKHPSLSPDSQTQEGVGRWWQQGVRSMLPSMSAAIPGMIGGAVGGPIGAAVGGGVMSGAIFGLAEFDSVREEGEDLIAEKMASGDMTEDEAMVVRSEIRAAAINSAAVEGGMEGIANAVQAKVLSKWFPGRKTLKNLAKRPIKDIFKKTAKEAVKTGAKQLALTTPVEVGTEFAQAALETKFRRDVGLTDMDSWGAGIDALGPAFVTNLLFFGAGKSANAAQRWGIRHSLEQAGTDDNKRMGAVRDIANIVRGMSDPNAEGIANKMEAVGMSYVRSGMSIDINSDLGMETMLEKYKEGVEDGSITNIQSNRLQKALQEDMDNKKIPLQKRVPSFQMFQGISKINKDDQEFRAELEKEEEAELKKPVLGDFAAMLKHNASLATNKAQEVGSMITKTLAKSKSKAKAEKTRVKARDAKSRSDAKSLKAAEKGKQVNIDAEVDGLLRVAREATDEGSTKQEQQDEALTGRVKASAKIDQALEKQEGKSLAVEGLISKSEQAQMESGVTSQAKKERQAERGRSIREEELIPEGEQDVTGIPEDDDVPTEQPVDRGEEFAQEETVVSKKETPPVVAKKVPSKPEVISQDKEVVKAVEKKLEEEAPKRKGELIPLSKKDELQVRKELKDPDITKGEKKDLEQILIDADLPVVVEKKVPGIKKEKAVDLPTFEQTKKGLGDIETEIRKASTRFIHAAVKPKEKAELGARIKALKAQEDIVREKIGLDPKNVVIAKKNIRDKLGLTGRIGMGVDPTVIKDLGVVGGHHFKKGSRTFAEWAKKMIADFGEGIRSVLRMVFRTIKSNASKSVNAGVVSADAIKPEPTKAISAIDDEVKVVKSEFVKRGNKARKFEDKDIPGISPEANEIFKNKLGPRVVGETFKERWARMTADWRLKLQQGIVDKYASIQKLDERLWKLVQVTSSSSGAIEAIMTHGPIATSKGENGVIDNITTMRDTGKEGLLDVIRPLGNEVERFLGMAAGRRAEVLLEEGNENLLTEDEVKLLLELDKDKMADGRSRRSVYREVFKGLKRLNDSILDIAVESGVLSKEDRRKWAKRSEKIGFHLPFFRLKEEDLDIKGPRSVGGLVGKNVFERLKGGKEPIADMLSNLVINWNHMISSAATNNAARQVVEKASKTEFTDGTPIATRIRVKLSLVSGKDGKHEVVDEDGKNIGGKFDEITEASEFLEKEKGRIAKELSNKSSNVVFVRENGEKAWYEVHSPMLYQSLTSMHVEGFNNRPMKAMRAFKRALTFGVTASPAFKIRGLFRDTLSAAGTTPVGMNLYDNVFGTGGRTVFKDAAASARMMAGGGSFQMGHVYGSNGEKLEQQLNKRLKAENILDNPGGWAVFKRVSAKVVGAWNDFGSNLENINRAAVFVNTLKEFDETGKSGGHLEASFQGRDLLDFHRHGAWPAIRFLTDVVPFMNARIQSLDKIKRAATGTTAEKKRLALIIGATSMASMMLYLAYKDDDDFKAREEWDRDTYWWIKIPGTDIKFKLPKPFEIGAIGTMAERLLEQFVDDEVHGELFAERLGFMLTETFSLGVTPQAVKPVLELMANKNFFTDRPIETMAMDNLSPTERKKAWTSETTIVMSRGINKIPWDRVHLSPVQIEHLIRGYLGWVGATALSAIDQVFTQPLGGFPGRPSRRIEEYPLFGPFTETTPSRHTKYSSLFYEGLKEMNQTYADIRNYRTLGETEKAINLARKNKDKLRFRKLANKIQKNVANVTKRIRLTRLSKNMSAQEKRAKIDKLTVIKNKLLKMAVKKTGL